MQSPLPIRNGVSASKHFLPVGDWSSMLEFLLDYFPNVSREIWLARMESGEVVNANGGKLAPDDPYQAGTMIYYYREVDDETPVPFDEVVLLQDEHLLVVDKPHFLPVIPAGRFLHETLLVRLKHKLQLEHLIPLHRLDRETAGVVLFSHNPESRGAYASLFEQCEMSKVYEAIAPTLTDRPLPLTYRSRIEKGDPFFRMQEVVGEPNSETFIELIEQHGDISRYRLRPVTGKKHQLRLHMAALGVPILNDKTYPELQPERGEDFAAPLQLLAKTIAFEDPFSGERRFFESDRDLEL